MPNPATVVDIESRWRPLQGYENTVAATRLDDAWNKLRVAIPTLEARMATSNIDGAVITVLADAVIRLLRNPEGVRRRTVTVDDATSTADYGDSGIVTGSVYFTDAELDSLAGTVTRRRARAFSVQPS